MLNIYSNWSKVIFSFYTFIFLVPGTPSIGCLIMVRTIGIQNFVIDLNPENKIKLIKSEPAYCAFHHEARPTGR